jgi:hypothetical protein
MPLNSRNLKLGPIVLAVAPIVLGLAVGRLAIAQDADRVAVLVAQLGDDDAIVREAASEELTQIGMPALAALDAATRNSDLEIRYRSRRIVALVRQLDQEKRLEAFLDGKEDPTGYTLPGWRRFKKSYGDDAASRSLFVEMQRADAELMQAMETGPEAAAEVLSLRVAQDQQARQSGARVSAGQAAATLFVAAADDAAIPAQTQLMVLQQCLQQGFRELLSQSSKKALPRKMLAAIIVRSEDWAAYQAMHVAMQYDMPEGLAPATKILSNPGERVAHMIQPALMTVVKLGDSSHVPLVEKLLDDRSTVSKIQETVMKDGKNVATNYEMQLRDSALAAVILLSKQNLTDYFDVPEQQRQLLAEPQMIFYNPRLIGFASEEEREVVFEKWAKFKGAATKPAGDKPVDAATP